MAVGLVALVATVGLVKLSGDLHIRSSAIVLNPAQTYADGDFAVGIAVAVLQRSHARSPYSGIYPNEVAARLEDALL
jgi:hypothetical protein